MPVLPSHAGNRKKTKKTECYWLSSQVLLHQNLGSKELKFGFVQIRILRSFRSTKRS